MKPQIYTFAAYSGTGKTAYLSKLIPCLKQAGLRVAVIKHDVHGIQADTEGKDSWCFSQAGADAVAVVSHEGMVLFDHRRPTLETALSHMQAVDIILTEGYKRGPYPKIALFREDSGRELATAPEECFAIVSDAPMEAPCPIFPLDDPRALAEYLLWHIQQEGEKRNVHHG